MDGGPAWRLYRPISWQGDHQSGAAHRSCRNHPFSPASASIPQFPADRLGKAGSDQSGAPEKSAQRSDLYILLLALKISMPAARGFIDFGLLPDGSILAPILMILYSAMVLNLVLAFFNLMPIPPLDGHWILYGVLPGSAAAALEKIAPYGFIIIYALMFIGVFRIILGPIVSILITLLRAF